MCTTASFVESVGSRQIALLCFIRLCLVEAITTLYACGSEQSMKNLPFKAQIFLSVVALLGATSAFAGLYRTLPQFRSQAWEIVLFLTLAALAGSKKITLMRHKGSDDVGSMSLGFAITFAALLHFGPSISLLVAVFSCLTGCLFPKPQPTYQIVFNVALSAIEASVAGAVFMALNGGTLTLHPLEAFQAVVGSALTYFAINTGSVAVIISLCTDKNPFTLWRQTFLWTAPSYFAGASVSTLAVIISGRQISGILLFASPVIYLTYYSYAIYTSREEEKLQHIEDLQIGKEQLADLYLATIKSLALAIDAKDQYTHQHIIRVQRYSVAIAEELGLNAIDMEGIRTGALLHDIGKLGVPEYVLLKPGKLTADEYDKIKKHPEIGAAILDPVEFPWPVLPVVKYHHEKWDGTGYPEGLKGEAIPFTARILAVADVYDALTSTRSYRDAWTHERAIGVITKDSGSHFDPVVVEAFLRVIEGVVKEMATEGQGPLAPKLIEQPVTNITDKAVRDIQRASAELWALYEIAQTLSSSLGLSETLDILARKLEGIFAFSTCLFLMKEDTGHLRVSSTTGMNRDFFMNSHTINSESRSWQVALTGETYLGAYDPDDLMLESQGSVWFPMKTALIAPIIHQGEALGTINLYHQNAGAFEQYDKQLLEIIAERAALAFYNGLLYDRTRGQAYTDPLTGANNIRYMTKYLDDRCHAAAGRRHPHSNDTFPLEPLALSDSEASPLRESDRFALLCLDLDSFKPINDNFGHQKGDTVLRDLVAIFRSIVREQDVIARYGGDEFLIVLEGADADVATQMIDRLQDAVSQYDPGLMHSRIGRLRIGVSIGYACFPIDGDDSAVLLSVADSRMYVQKTDRKLCALAS